MNFKISNKSVIRILLVVILMEAILGGGGRVFDFGSISPRMYLFAIAVFLGIFAVASRLIDKNFAYIITAYTFFLIYFSIIGFINGASTTFVLLDLKPLLGFYYLLFFFFAIRSKDDVLVVSRVIKFGAIGLATGYLIVFVGINFGVIPFMTFYQLVAPSEEFFFRGDFAFFYKGFIYLGIGVFFYGYDKNRIPLIILITALILTFTRGFVLSTLMVYFIYLVFIRKAMVKLIVLMVLVALTGSAIWRIVSQSDSLDRNKSDGDRIVQIKEVFDETNVLTCITGHGFGIGIPSRPERMEITYLEIFHKQGIIGLLFWIGLLFFSWKLFLKRKHEIALPFILSIIFIYIQSVSNPFLMNPIGLIMISVSLVCLHILRKDKVMSTISA